MSFPGHPRRFPLPDRVGEYGDRRAFEQCRKESGQWVFWEDRVELVLAGRYDEVRPLHIELSPTYLCNFACPWCSCRAAREDWSDEDVFHHPLATPRTVMAWEKIDRVLRHLAADRVAIMWVGGEPTMNPLLYPAACRAHELGLQQCLFTNGSLFNEKRIDALLDANLVFIRVSLDAATDKVHQVHHGYQARRGYAEKVKQGLALLLRRRIETGAKTLIGVSIVVDECNLGDLVPTAQYLRLLCDEFGPGAVDYLIIRPVYQFYTSQVQLGDTTRSRLYEMVRAGAQVAKILESCGVRVVAPEESFTDPVREPELDEGERCLSCGWFSEVTANGDMVLCSDRYGNPDYFIGNLAVHGLEELWDGERRREVLRSVEQTSCFRRQCPRNGRGFQLNRVFHRIERFRREGRIAEVRAWIDDLRRVLARPSHPFFL